MVDFLDITLDWIVKNKIRGGGANSAKAKIVTTPTQQKCDEKKKWLFQEYDDAKLPIIDLKDIRLGACLGKGKYSKVYEIIRMPDEKLSTSSLLSSKKKGSLMKKKKYAMKVLRNYTGRVGKEYVQDAKKALKQEIHILSSLNHENILRIYGYGCISTTNDNNFLIIDQIEETLDEKMQGWKIINSYGYDYDYFHYHKKKDQKTSNIYGSYSDYCGSINNETDNIINNDSSDKINKYHSWLLLKEKINIAQQIVDALRYMHDCGYSYRDLKPHNTGLLHSKNLGRATVVKLFDFGTSRKLPSQPIHGKEGQFEMTLIGSPRYMAPEIHGGIWYNEKVDVYSWSILLYEMLTLDCAYRPYHPLEYYTKLYLNRERPRLDDRFVKRKRYNLCSDEFRYSLSVPKEIKELLKCSWEGSISKRYSSYELQQKLLSFSSRNNFELPKSCCHQGQKQGERKTQESSEIFDETETANETESNFY